MASDPTPDIHQYLFPGEGSRLFYGPGQRRGSALTATNGVQVAVYSDPEGTDLAPITDLDGNQITDSLLPIGSDSRIPLFRGAPGVRELYVRVVGDSHPPARIHPSLLDAIDNSPSSSGIDSVARQMAEVAQDDIATHLGSTSGAHPASAISGLSDAIDGRVGNAISAHSEDVDPHGDRAYAEQLIDALTADDISDATDLGKTILRSVDPDDIREILGVDPAATQGGIITAAPSGGGRPYATADLLGVNTSASSITVHVEGEEDHLVILPPPAHLREIPDLVVVVVTDNPLRVASTMESPGSPSAVLHYASDIASSASFPFTTVMDGDRVTWVASAPPTIDLAMGLPSPSGEPVGHVLTVIEQDGKKALRWMPPEDITSANITDATPIGVDLLTSSSTESARDAISAAAKAHGHVASDISGLSAVATSGRYSDLSGSPAIPTNPGDIGAAPATHSHTASQVTGLAGVATSGQYADLLGKPTIPSEPGDVGAAPVSHSHPASQVTGLAEVAKTGQYSDLSGRPSIPTDPSDIGAARAIHEHGQGDVLGLVDTLGAKADLVGGKIPTSQIPALATTEVYTVGSDAEMLALDCQRGDMAIRTDVARTYILAGEDPSQMDEWVSLPSPSSPIYSVQGQIGDVVLGPSDIGAAPASHTHPASQVSGLSPVATSGAYGDLSNKPSIPTNPGDIGAASASHIHSTDDIQGLSAVATTGNYSSLTGKPSIPDEPEDIGAAPAVHSHTTGEIIGLAAVADTGSYLDLSNRPSIPSSPGDVGADPAGTAQALIDALADVATSGSYSDLSNKPSIPSGPGDIGAEVAGAATSAISAHVAASDPHGDRAYAISIIDALTASDVGADPTGTAEQAVSSHNSDETSHGMTPIGRNLLRAASTINARMAIAAEEHGAGAAAVSSHNDDASAHGQTAIGRSVLTAPNATSARSAIGAAPESHTHTTANITNATEIGRNLMTASSEALARQEILAEELGMSVVEVGFHNDSTTAHGMTATGRNVLTATNATAARSAIEAAPAVHTHEASQISDATATGRNILTAQNPNSARILIGAVSGENSISAIRQITKAAYDALGTKNPETLYVIVG